VEYGEILWADEVDPRLLLFCRRLAGNFEALLGRRRYWTARR
jgi:hypothetical protein